jgi:plastocyanin
MKRSLIVALTLAAFAVPFVAHGFAATRYVSVKDDYFTPRAVSISKYTTLRWIWRGRGRHNVVVDRGPAGFRSSIKRTGGFSHTFTKRGTYRIVCTVHPDMTMTVRVS